MAAEAVTLDAGVSVECLAWSPTGQLLLAATASGTMHCFLGLLPVISAVHGGAIAHMTALTEATVSHGLAADPERVGVPMLATPHFMALNGSKLIAAVNNCAHTYDLDAAMAPPRSREYPGGTIDGVQASDTHVALRVDGRVVVHSVDAESECLVPHKERDVTAFALTDTFLILATSKGQLQHYGVRAGAVDPLNEYRHSRQNKPVGIEGVWAAPGAVHVVCSDASGTAFLFSPVNDQVRTLAQGFPVGFCVAKLLLWRCQWSMRLLYHGCQRAMPCMRAGDCSARALWSAGERGVSRPQPLDVPGSGGADLAPACHQRAQRSGYHRHSAQVLGGRVRRAATRAGRGDSGHAAGFWQATERQPGGPACNERSAGRRSI